MQHGRRLNLASGVIVSSDGVLGSLSDFSDFGKLLVVVSGRPTNRYRGAATVTVETSADGVSWTSAGSVTFGVAADQVVTVSSPDVYVRASASGLTGAWAFTVDVIPAEVNVAGGGGGLSNPVSEALVVAPASQSDTPLTLTGGGAGSDYGNVLEVENQDGAVGRLLYVDSAGEVEIHVRDNDALALTIFGAASGTQDLLRAKRGNTNVFAIGPSGEIKTFAALPTVDPTVAGQLWNDAGTLKVSAG